MKKVENVKSNNIGHKSFLIITKFIPHISAFLYMLYTLLQFADIDTFILGYVIDYSILPWLYVYLASFVFKYCYVHRLPLYYILINEILTTSDYYLNIPINDLNLLLIHLSLIGFLIFGYSYYYIKFKNSMRDFRKFCRPKIKSHSEVGDILIKLKCGTIGAMSPEEYKKVLKFFKLDSFVGESSSSAGKVIATNKITGDTAVFDVETYNLVKDLFEILEIVGEKYEDPTNGQDYVEIGGLKWATMNIGASQPSDYGLYFQWGDTQGYTAKQVGSGEGQKYFGWADYKYGNGTSSPGTTGMTKYNATDGKTILEASDDAAVANWGGSWRMPTTAEFQALGNAVNTAWTADYQGSGVAGLVCTDKTDSSKTLFFPAAGLCYNGSVDYVGYYGRYWSSSLFTSLRQNAYGLLFNSSDAYWNRSNVRYVGFAVRPVLDFSAQIPENPAQEGDIICYNSELDRQAIFSYSDWINLDDSWDAIGLYGIETFDNDDEVTEERKVIMSNGTTFIIKSTDYSSVSSHWEVVDTIIILAKD